MSDHLGGHYGITHVDRGALSLLKRDLGIETMIDIGCGPGGMVVLARDMGIKAFGVDGDTSTNLFKTAPQWVTAVDYELGSAGLATSTFDLAWSCEFIEHVYPQFIPHYMADFQRAKYVCVTYAPPGTPGHHHVNCKDEQYWINMFTAYGFEHSEGLTDQVREASSMKRDFVRHHGLVFINTGLP